MTQRERLWREVGFMWEPTVDLQDCGGGRLSYGVGGGAGVGALVVHGNVSDPQRARRQGDGAGVQQPVLPVPQHRGARNT